MTRRILAVLLTLIFTATIDCRANAAQAAKFGNIESAQKFAEYGDITPTEENQHLDNLAAQLRISSKLIAYIIVYAGRRAHPFEARQHFERLYSYIFDEQDIDERRLMMIDGGFRESPAVEIFLVPRTAKGPEPTPTVRAREVEFIITDALEMVAINKDADEILASALNKAVPKYPPLAKAARVTGEVGVRVTIDEEGRVVEARTMFGHPLLVDASEKGAREWRFTPFNEAGRPVKVVGLLIFTFDLDIDQKN